MDWIIGKIAEEMGILEGQEHCWEREQEDKVMAKRRKFTMEEIKDIKFKYSTNEYSYTDLAMEYNTYAATIANLVGRPFKEDSKRKTDTNDRTEKIEQHILECFDNDTETLIGTIDNLLYKSSVRQACNEVVQGGCLLVYYNQVNDFLAELDCVLGSDDQNWSMYKKLCVQRMEKMYSKYKKERK